MYAAPLVGAKSWGPSLSGAGSLGLPLAAAAGGAASGWGVGLAAAPLVAGGCWVVADGATAGAGSAVASGTWAMKGPECK